MSEFTSFENFGNYYFIYNNSSFEFYLVALLAVWFLISVEIGIKKILIGFDIIKDPLTINVEQYHLDNITTNKNSKAKIPTEMISISTNTIDCTK